MERAQAVAVKFPQELLILKKYMPSPTVYVGTSKISKITKVVQIIRGKISTNAHTTPMCWSSSPYDMATFRTST